MNKKIILAVVELLCKLHILSPIQVARLKHYYKFHMFPDYEHPRDLNEKINWMKFYGDTSQWADLADKYKVREFIESLGLGDTLVKLYGKWDNANEIDWEKCPDKFVLKVNNGSGDVLICKDRSKLDIPVVIAKYNKLVSMKYGDVSGEPHYATIKPCIIMEELLDITKQSGESTSLIDYKIWCFNGKPYYTWAAWNRKGHSADSALYDMDWNYHPEWSVFTNSFPKPTQSLPKPKAFDRLMEVAAILSKGHPVVRVDLYEVNGKVYFGELTFTSLGGFMDYYSKDFLDVCGALIKLPCE